MSCEGKGDDGHRDLQTICLFDVDGTLSPSRKVATDEMKACLDRLRGKCVVGVVSGSDLKKIKEQLGEDLVEKYDYVFTENGLVAHHNGSLLEARSILDELGEEKTQDLINFALSYMSQLRLPAKRGTFVEFRTGLINLCPVGRSCTQAERDAFADFDSENFVRQKMVEALHKRFPENKLNFAIGGQISIDVFPQGWDKRYCLRYLESNFRRIVFFGDRTEVGGNDHEIYSDLRTEGIAVKNPADTLAQLNKLFGV